MKAGGGKSVRIGERELEIEKEERTQTWREKVLEEQREMRNKSVLETGPTRLMKCVSNSFAQHVKHFMVSESDVKHESTLLNVQALLELPFVSSTA